MNVVLTEPALADLREVVHWIGKDSIRAAEKFSIQLRRCCLQLGTRATIYPFATGLERADIRRRVFRKYLIFYRVGPTSVQVLGVLHGSRDWLALMDARAR